MWEWWTYSPSDFIMYSASTYLRIVRSHNAVLWPAPLFALALAGVMTAAGWRGSEPRRRIVFAALAAAWVSVATFWFFARFGTIHTYASAFGTAFLVEASLLLWLAVKPPVETRSTRAARIAVVIALAAIVVYPAIGVVAGRRVDEAEVFALMPVPTALATVALLPASSRSSRLAFIIPVLWTVWDFLGLWALGFREAIAIATIGAAAIVGRRAGAPIAIATAVIPPRPESPVRPKG